MIPYRPDCLFCRGALKHSETEHVSAVRDFEGVLMRVRGDEWHARTAEQRDRELVRLTPDVRLAATAGPERSKKNRGRTDR